MYKILDYLIDFIFPPSKEELRIREISPGAFLKTVPGAPPTEFPFIRSLFSYKEPLVTELIWQIKYKKNKHAIEIAGYALHNELSKNPGKILLIPIPLSNKRRRERGYNQCELIVDEIIRLDKNNKLNKNYNLLVRLKDIEKQTFKNRNERIENTKKIFEVLGEKVEIDKNQKIIIIDDVTTTGSTLKEARETLLRKGFISVQALTVAH